MDMLLRNLKTGGLLISIIILAVLTGCAASTGRTFLYPAGDLLTGSYHKKGAEEAVFENKSLRVAVRHVKSSENEANPLLKVLSDRKYVILSVSIENKTKLKAAYNPSMTVLTDDSLDYLKPLDYTDLYDLTNGDAALEAALSAMKDKFYDLGLTLRPGEKSARLLIFEPLTKNTDKAELAMNEIYLGTDTLSLRFPFILKSPEI